MVLPSNAAETHGAFHEIDDPWGHKEPRQTGPSLFQEDYKVNLYSRLPEGSYPWLTASVAADSENRLSELYHIAALPLAGTRPRIGNFCL